MKKLRLLLSPLPASLALVSCGTVKKDAETNDVNEFFNSLKSTTMSKFDFTYQIFQNTRVDSQVLTSLGLNFNSFSEYLIEHNIFVTKAYKSSEVTWTIEKNGKTISSHTSLFDEFGVGTSWVSEFKDLVESIEYLLTEDEFDSSLNAYTPNSDYGDGFLRITNESTENLYKINPRLDDEGESCINKLINFENKNLVRINVAKKTSSDTIVFQYKSYDEKRNDLLIEVPQSGFATNEVYSYAKEKLRLVNKSTYTHEVFNRDDDDQNWTELTSRNNDSDLGLEWNVIEDIYTFIPTTYQIKFKRWFENDLTPKKNWIKFGIFSEDVLLTEVNVEIVHYARDLRVRGFLESEIKGNDTSTLDESEFINKVITGDFINDNIKYQIFDVSHFGELGINNFMFLETARLDSWELYVHKSFKSHSVDYLIIDKSDDPSPDLELVIEFNFPEA